MGIFDRRAAGVASSQQGHGVTIGRSVRDDSGGDATPAAVLFSTVIDWPSGPVILSASILLMMSGLPPGWFDQNAQRALRPVLLGADRQRAAGGESGG